jgi:hypothetical protein
MKEKIKEYFKSESFKYTLWVIFFILVPILLWLLVLEDPIIGDNTYIGAYIVCGLFWVASYSIYKLKETKRELERSKDFTRKLHNEFKQLKGENGQLKEKIVLGNENLKEAYYDHTNFILLDNINFNDINQRQNTLINLYEKIIQINPTKNDYINFANYLNDIGKKEEANKLFLKVKNLTD